MVTLPRYLDDAERSPLTLAAGLRRVMSFPLMLGAMLVAGCYIVAKESVLDPDTWWHVTVGQKILATHTWPWSDTYSGTVSGAPWIAYEWLGDVLMGAAASIAGMRGETFLLLALSSVLVLLIYCYAAIRCGNSKAAFVACATIVPLLGAFFTLRPQILGVIFLVLTLIVLERFRQGHERALLFLPFIFLLWVNTHGSFVFGFFAIGVTWLAGQFEFSSGGVFAERWTKRQSVQLLLATLASSAVLPVTPYGSRVASYPLVMALTQPLNVKSIQEWRPLSADLFIGKYFLALVLLFFLACLLLRPAFRLSEMTLALCGAAAAFLHLRFLLLFVIFYAPVWAVLFSRWIPRYRPKEDRPAINAVLIALLAAAMVHYFPTQARLDEQITKEYPTAALQYLGAHPVNGNVFSDYGWGGYLISAGQPRRGVFIDGRADIYEYGGVLADYMSIALVQPHALQLLKRYNVEACLIKQDAPLATVLDGRPGWERVYRDGVASLYVRTPLASPAARIPARPAD